MLVLFTRGVFWEIDNTVTLPRTQGLHSMGSVLGCRSKCPEWPFVSSPWTHATVMDAFGSWWGLACVWTCSHLELTACWSCVAPGCSWYSLSCTKSASNPSQVPFPDRLGNYFQGIILKRKLVKESQHLFLIFCCSHSFSRGRGCGGERRDRERGRKKLEHP